MQKSKKLRARSRRDTNRRNFLRLERLEDRMVLTGAAPIAVNDSFHTLSDQTLEISAPGILANDTDAEGDALSAILFSGPAHGTLTMQPDGGFQYIPESGFAGIDSFMYSAADDTSCSLLAAVTLRVGNGGVPTSQDDSFTVNEDATLTVPSPAGVLHNDSDPDGDAMTAALVTGPANGAVELASDGSFVYTPAANFHGTDSFVYQASDGSGVGNEATVTITVNSVNDVPVASNDSFSLDEDSPLSISGPGVMANDTDADGETLTSSVVSGPLHGSLTLSPDGSFTYTPAENFHGVDGFSYLVSDGATTSNVATVTLVVNSLNDLPVAAADAYSTAEDTELVVDAAAGLLGNDTDADGDSLIASLVSGPAHGVLTLSSDGSFVYTPEANFNGADEFTYVVNDGTADSEVATVSLTVTAVNDVPAAVNDEYTIDEDTSLTLPAPGILGNDTDGDGDPLAASLVSGPLHGTLTLNADGSLTYTPEANFNGTDGFSYVVNDGSADSAVATVTINVTAVNDGPIAVNDEFTMEEDATLTVDAPGILGNDSDIEGDPLATSLVSGPSHGALTLNADGSLSYTPEANFNGADSFTYMVNDGSADSEAATVTINVTAVNDGPVAVNDAYTMDEDTTLTLAAPGILGNDTDPDGDTLSASLVSGPSHGTLTLNADGSVSYTPEVNFNGTDSFTYLASDGSLESAAATVTIDVGGIEDPPLAVNDEYTTDEDVPLAVDVATGLLANDSDPDSSSLTVSLVSGPVNGSVTLNPDGSFNYVPNADFHGVDGFSYTVSDGTLESDVATVTLNVTSVDDAPVAQNDAYSTDEETTLTVDAAGVLANDSDVDGDPLSAALVSGPSHGTLTLNADGSFSYTPEADFSGEDSFVYKAEAGSLSGEATVTISVNSLNDAPVGVADEYTVDEDGILNVDAADGVLTNDTDPDGDTLSAVLVSGPTSGTMTLNGDGSFDYAPGANFNGSDSFVYMASDGTTESAETTVTITVNPGNDAPVAEADSFTTDEDVPLTVVAPGVLGNDSDLDGDAITAVLVAGPAHGTVTLEADGSLVYTPEANFNGSDSFTYKATDGSLESGETTVNITVNPVADAPQSNADAYSTGEDVPLTVSAELGALANDFDPQGLPLTAELVSGPTSGTLSLNADGSFSYTANANFYGTDSFTYVANNGVEASPATTVNIVIQALNDAPVAVNDAYDTDSSGSVTATAETGVMANDSDIDGDALSATLLWGPAHGEVTFNSDGSFTYTAAEGYSGEDSFKYQLNDGMANSNVATVTLHMVEESENTPPVSQDDSYTVDAGSTLTVDAPGVLGNDADGEPMTTELVAGPANGALSLNTDGSFSYTPNDGFSGTDSFTYTASDGIFSGNVATVTIDVQAGSENQNPVATTDTYEADAETLLSVSAAEGVLGNDTDADGDPLTAALVDGPAHGTVTLNADGSFDYQPEAGFAGADTFTYQASDGTGVSEVTTVTVNVSSADNQRPVAVNDTFTTTVDQPLSVDALGLLGNDTDADGDSLTAILFSGPQNGTLVFNSDGSFVYTPSAGFQGRDSFIYRVFDGEVHSALAAVTIHVNAAPAESPPVESPPVETPPSETPPSEGSGCGQNAASSLALLRSLDQDFAWDGDTLGDDLLDTLAGGQDGRFENLDDLLTDDGWLA